MPWFGYLLAAGNPTSLTPVDAATTSILGYVSGFGILGYLVLALVFRWLVPGRTAERDRAQARADLEAELGRVLAEKKHVEEQRDDALKFARDDLVPLLTSFTATTSALIPLLQEVVRSQESGGGQSGPRWPR